MKKTCLSITVLIFLLAGCTRPTKTVVSVRGEKWYFNDKILNEDSPAEGLLMNVRMVNSVFEERGDKMPSEFKGFDAEKNTDEFISGIPEYVASGVNCFTICLQGGAPGYEGSVNTAYDPDGSLRKEYMDRVTRVIKAADENNAAIILTCFYQRQHSHFSALTGKDAIKTALVNTVNWIKKNKFRNVIFEVSNEYRHGGYRNWNDGKWIASTKGQVELMQLAKSVYPELLIGTSGMGDARLVDSLAMTADYITIHFNSTSLEDYAQKIKDMKRWGKPVICNEDDKLAAAGASACLLSVINGCGWGFMHSRKNQTIPFGFEGISDDSAVYSMMKNVASPGFKIDDPELTQTSLVITAPNDGEIIETGRKITVKFSYLFPDTAEKSIMKLLGNGKELAVAEDNARQFSIVVSEPGIVLLETVAADSKGIVRLKSRPVDIIVK
jgi:hypothetical protein